jgi:hypothetical protein
VTFLRFLKTLAGSLGRRYQHQPIGTENCT